jgi:hypothetical protein
VITDDELIRLLELADPALVDDPAPVLGPAEYRDALNTRSTTVILIEQEPAPTQPTSGRRWPILIVAAAAVVLVVGVLVVRGGDDNEIEVPGAPPSTVSSTTVDTSSTPSDRTIACGSEQCPWSPELTAQTLELPIICTSASSCARKTWAVSPDGTLVAYDGATRTLTWYEDVARVVSITAELPGDDHELVAIGPHDIAYVASGGEEETVAVAPSGAEITRVEWPSRRVFNGVVLSNMPTSATAAGLIAANDPGWPTVIPAPVMPWVDLDGNPITDTRPYPTAKATPAGATRAGTEVRLGERAWLLAVVDGVYRDPVDFVSRSDGGVVMVVATFGVGEDAQPTNVLQLSPDGSIGRYFVEPAPIVLPDGSLVVEYGAQLVRLTPPG